MVPRGLGLLGSEGFQGYRAFSDRTGRRPGALGWLVPVSFPRFLPELESLAALRPSRCHGEEQIPAESEGTLKGDNQTEVSGTPNP